MYSLFFLFIVMTPHGKST